MAAAKDPYGYREMVKEVIEKHQIADPAEVILALLYMLKEFHTAAVYSDSGKVFQDGMDRITGRHAISPADSLRNLAWATSGVGGQHPAGLQCLSDTLSRVIPGWEAEGEHIKRRIENLPRHIAPREGDPIGKPWEGHPVDFEDRPMKEPWDGRTISAQSPQDE